MVNFELMLTGVLAVSVATSLTTEAIKMLAGDRKWNWNIVSCIVTLVLAIGACAGYAINNNVALTAQFALVVIAFTYICWLCAMLGYDKVTEAFGKIKKP